MSNNWSRDDKLFVDGELEVLSFNLRLANSPLQSLPMERRSDFVYDGPKGDDFKDYLSKNDFRVNHKGRVIVVVPGRNEKVEAFRYFLLDKVVPLRRFGFENSPLPKNKEVTELKSLLDNSKAELEKKNDELNESRKQLDSIKTELMDKITEMKKEVMELQSLLDNSKAELEKKNNELNELGKQLDSIKTELTDKITVMKKEVMESQSRLNEAEAELAKNYQVSKSQRQQMKLMENPPLAKFSPSQRHLMELMENPPLAKFPPSWVLGDLSNNFEFLRRINGTYVNSKGIYVKLDFIGAKSSGPWVTTDNSIYRYDSNAIFTDFFSFAQFDWNKPAMDIQERRVVLPQKGETGGYADMQWDPEALGTVGYVAAFTFKEFCFIGRMMQVFDTFFENALVTVFFEQTKYDKNNCYVDALATTFHVLKTKNVYWSEAIKTEIPRFIS